MPKGPFNPSQFTATQWSTVEEKAQFGNTLLHFIDNECKETLFTKKFYNRLMNTFGHIAHYNREGFYAEWFTNNADRLHFIDHLLRWPCHGDATFTFCDVERAIQGEVRSRNYLAKYRVIVAEETRAHEIAVLTRLEAKYRTASSPEPAADLTPPLDPMPSQAMASQAPIQGTLF